MPQARRPPHGERPLAHLINQIVLSAVQKAADGHAYPDQLVVSHLETLIDEPIFSILPLSGDDKYSMKFQEVIGVNDIPLFVNLKTSEHSDLRGDLFFPEASGKLGDFTDGIIYFGTEPDAEAEYDQEAENDSSYQAEFERRRAIESSWR